MPVPDNRPDSQLDMPDNDPPGPGESSIANDPAMPAGERRNLPVPVPPPSPLEDARSVGDSWFSRVLRAMFGWRTGSFRADLKDMLEGNGETGFSPEEVTLLRNILAAREARVDDIMIPRADIIAVQKDIILGELIRVFEGAGHSRLVVYDDTLDDPIGMVHIRDLIAFMTAQAVVKPSTGARRKKPLPADLNLAEVDLSTPLSATKIVREMLFVPPSMPAMDLLAKMQATRIHLALVIDEYGGADGLVSIEDIVELIVGDIADEHDEDVLPAIEPQADGSFLADARASLEDVTAIVGAEFDVGEMADEVDTIGGYLVTKIGRLPVRGELIPGPGKFEFEVLDADPRRVKRLRIYRTRARAEARARDGRRRPNTAESASAPASPATTSPELPAANDESVRLSPDPGPAKDPHGP